MVSSSDGAKLAAASYNGYIYASNDTGVTWVPLTNAGLRNWSSIASSANGTKLVAGEYSGYIYTSNDGGLTWKLQANSPNKTCYKLVCDANCTNMAAACGTSGIFTSNDSGASWTHRTSGISGISVYGSLTCDSNTCTNIVAADSSPNFYIYVSSNGGQSWTPHNIGNSLYWLSAASSSDGSKVVLGSSGYNGGGNYETGSVWTSSNSGSSWSNRIAAQSVGGTPTVGYVEFASSSDGKKMVMATTDYVNVYTSSNSGSSWVRQSNFSTIASAASSFLACDSNCTKIVLAVSSSFIYTSNDSGVTWRIAF